MKRELQDGLIMNNTVMIIDEKKPGFPVSARVFQFFAILIGSWSFVTVFQESLKIPVNFFELNAAVLICTAILYALCFIPSYDIVKLFFGILFYGLFFFSRLPRLKNAFYILENLVLDRLSAYYNYHSDYFMADYTAAQRDTTLLVIMVLIPMAALLAAAVMRSRYINLSGLLLFIPVSISFLFGVIPSEGCLIAYVIAVLYLSRSGFSFHHAANKDQKTILHRINSRAAVWLSLIGVILFFVLKLFVPKEQYDNITAINTMKTRIQTTLFNFTLDDVSNKFSEIHLPGGSISVGGLNGGELGKTSDVKYSGSLQLEVSAPRVSAEEGLYLKGYVGSVYTGDSWDGHSKEDKKKYKELLKNIPEGEFTPGNQVNSLLQSVLNNVDALPSLSGVADNSSITPDNLSIIYQFQIYQGKFNVVYKNANKQYIYAPYFTDYDQLENAYYEQDLYSAPRNKKKKYEFDYFFNLTLGSLPYSMFGDLSSKMGGYSKYEKLYRDYVHQVYTELPSKGLERLKSDFAQSNFTAWTESQKIDYVKNYLEQNTHYTLSPGKLPKGKDFVEYFLYENKVGYCSHYASAGTLMLRAMGVPARYVEGYAIGPGEASQSMLQLQEVTSYSGAGITQEDMQMMKIPVKDYNAHAWVEVYIDGCGWIPVEFTPGSAIDFNRSIVNSLASANNNDNSNASPELTPTDTPSQPTPAVKDKADDYRSDHKKQQSPSSILTKEQKAKQDRALFAVLGAMSIIAGSIFIHLRVRKRRRIRGTKNHNKRALLLFAETEKVLASGKGLPGRLARLEDSEEYVKEKYAYMETEMIENCFETVKKARFGKESITPQELREVELFYRRIYRRVCHDLPLHKRVYLKLILYM